MLKPCLLLLILFTCAKSFAQVNLVRNGGFEKYSTCPDNGDEIKFCKFWTGLDTIWNPPDWATTPPGVPEYCHVCAGSVTFAGVPYNSVSYQYPHSGGGLAEVQMFYNESILPWSLERDYLQGRLITELQSGKSYCVTFHVVLSESSVFAIGGIGAYLDDGTIDTTTHPGMVQAHCLPQVYSTSIIFDTLNWTRVQGTFVAEGHERFITLGHFKRRSSSLYLTVRDTTGSAPGSDFYTWYRIDDVSVISTDAIANAGLDKSILIGTPDSVWVGDSTGNYLPTYWYANGLKIDSNVSGLKVHPSVTTDYVMSLDVCGHITYDTVRVWVGPNAINGTAAEKVDVYPNPASDEFTVAHDANCQLTIYDVVGRPVLSRYIEDRKSRISITDLPQGSYTIQLVDTRSGERRLKLLIKN